MRLRVLMRSRTRETIGPSARSIGDGPPSAAAAPLDSDAKLTLGNALGSVLMNGYHLPGKMRGRMRVRYCRWIRELAAER